MGVKQKLRKRHLVIAFLGVVAVIIAATAVIFLKSPDYKIPEQFSGNFTPLFPGKDFRASNITTGEQRDILLFETDVSGHRVVVTQQPVPEDLDFSKLMSSSKYVTSYGEAHIINGDDYTTVSLLTDRHWLIAHSQGSVLGTKDVNDFLDSLSRPD